jgi:ketosteroid isomerase-like protein
MASVEHIIRKYFAVVADLSSTVEDLRAVVDPAACFEEMPNPIAPRGAVRGVPETTEGFLAGKRRLSAQHIDIHEIIVTGADRAVVRSTWSGRIGDTEVIAHMAGFLRVRDGRVVEHITYDCYEPFALGA